jgi:hypothetical protein
MGYVKSSPSLLFDTPALTIIQMLGLTNGDSSEAAERNLSCKESRH